MTCSREESIIILGRAFLITNILLIGMGIGFIIAGVLSVKELSSLKSDNIKPLLDHVLFDSNQAGSVAFGLSILIIFTGVLTLGVAGLGIFLISGNCCQMKCKLIWYAAFDTFVIITQVIFMALWSSWLIKNKLDCCGVQPVISKTNDFDQTPWCTTSGSCRTSSSDIPRTCCTGVDESNYSSAPVSCHGNVTSGTYNEKGCYEALKEKLLSQSPTFVGLTIASLVLEIGAGIIAIVIYQYFRKEKMGSGILDRLENCCGIILNQSQGRINTGKRDVAP